MLQFLLGLSDRQAAEAVRCRIDFKLALGMELDDPGFHHSELADFREPLAQGNHADRLLDLALARLKQAGLIRERTTQRTASTHVFGRGARPDPAGDGHRGGPCRAGRSHPQRRAPSGRPGRRGVGGPLWPSGPPGQEDRPVQDQDPRRRRRRLPAAGTPPTAWAGLPARRPRDGTDLSILLHPNEWLPVPFHHCACNGRNDVPGCSIPGLVR
nr:transposase [Streptomyces sp. WAC 06738]